MMIYFNVCLSYFAISGVKALALKVVYGPGTAWQSNVNVMCTNVSQFSRIQGQQFDRGAQCKN
jgi:hypothetical protein